MVVDRCEVGEIRGGLILASWVNQKVECQRKMFRMLAGRHNMNVSSIG